MYETAHARPDGDSTVDRLALTAAEYGYEGLVIRNHGDALPEYDRAAVAEAYGIDVVDGVEVRTTDPSRASGFVGNYRDRKTIVVVHGGDREMNRFAVEQPAVDVLAHPFADGGDVDHVMVKTAAENGVHIEYSLRSVLSESGGPRIEALRNRRKLWDLLSEYDAPYVVSGDSRGHLELRAPRELKALGESLGQARSWIERGLAAWGELAEKNRKRSSDSYVGPGVRREQADREE